MRDLRRTPSSGSESPVNCKAAKGRKNERKGENTAGALSALDRNVLTALPVVYWARLAAAPGQPAQTIVRTLTPQRERLSLVCCWHAQKPQPL